MRIVLKKMNETVTIGYTKKGFYYNGDINKLYQA